MILEFILSTPLHSGSSGVGKLKANFSLGLSIVRTGIISRTSDNLLIIWRISFYRRRLDLKRGRYTTNVVLRHRKYCIYYILLVLRMPIWLMFQNQVYDWSSLLFHFISFYPILLPFIFPFPILKQLKLINLLSLDPLYRLLEQRWCYNRLLSYIFATVVYKINYKLWPWLDRILLYSSIYSYPIN